MDNDKVYYSFKTLADVKRAMKVGLKFRCEHYRIPERTGARRRVYGSRADFCDLCGSGKIGVREPDAVRNRLKEY